MTQAYDSVKLVWLCFGSSLPDRLQVAGNLPIATLASDWHAQRHWPPPSQLQPLAQRRTSCTQPDVSDQAPVVTMRILLRQAQAGAQRGHSGGLVIRGNGLPTQRPAEQMPGHVSRRSSTVRQVPMQTLRLATTVLPEQVVCGAPPSRHCTSAVQVCAWTGTSAATVAKASSTSEAMIRNSDGMRRMSKFNPLPATSAIASRLRPDRAPAIRTGFDDDAQPRRRIALSGPPSGAIAG